MRYERGEGSVAHGGHVISAAAMDLSVGRQTCRWMRMDRRLQRVDAAGDYRAMWWAEYSVSRVEEKVGACSYVVAAGGWTIRSWRASSERRPSGRTLVTVVEGRGWALTRCDVLSYSSCARASNCEEKCQNVQIVPQTA